MKIWEQRERAREILAKEVGYVSKPHGGRLRVLEGRFGDMAQLLAPLNRDPVAGIALDLGVSSTQLDLPEDR